MTTFLAVMSLLGGIAMALGVEVYRDNKSSKTERIIFGTWWFSTVIFALCSVGMVISSAD